MTGSSIPRAHYRFFAVAGAALLATAALVMTQGSSVPPTIPDDATATGAIPADALVVVTADLARIRASGLGERLRAESREVPGLGDVREACGFDPIESFDAAAFAIPGGGADGDFGIAVLGQKATGEQLLACTTKVILARGGKPLASKLGTFDTVRDVGTSAPAGELAARPGGPFLLGAGSYLRAMVDAADGRVPSIRGGGEHARLGAALGGDPIATATLVLGSRQRATIADEVAHSGGGAPPAIAKIRAAAVGLETQGERVGLHAIVACDDGRGALDVANAIEDLRTKRADAPIARLTGIAAILTAIHVEVERDLVHARLVLPRQDAEAIVGLLLGGFGAPGGPAPSVAPEQRPSAAPALAPSASAAPSAAPQASAAPSASGAPSASAGRPPKKKKPPQPSRDELEVF